MKDNTVGSRLRLLREGLGISQKKMADMLKLGQSTINRYEQTQSEAPYKTLLWYADYFDVSLDYIFCRTDQPQGKLYNYEPGILKEKLAKQEDWNEFVEACFDPNSSLSGKLKEALMNVVKREVEG